MAYNKENQIRKIILVMEIVQEHFEPEITTYKGIWRKYVKPRYPMAYSTFIKYINTPIPKQK